MQNFKKNLITIITVVKNSAPTIEKCIRSVIDQNYDKIEHIIIDGKSNDGTIEILKKYKNKIDKIIIQNDKGIWDAMNKGVEIANGDIIGFLNADDYYNQNALNLVNKYFVNNKIDFLFGSVKKYKLMHGYRPWKIKWSFGFYSSHSVGFFIKKDVQKKIGYYDTQYKWSADYDLFYKMIVKFKLYGVATKNNEIFGKFRTGGLSSRISYLDFLLENNKIRLNNGQNFFLVYLIFILRILRNIKNFF